MSPSTVVPYRFESHEVRALNIDGDPWFVAKDVCDVLDLSDTYRAVAGLDDDEKGTSKVRTPGGDQEMIIISESGLYTLIIRSNKPQAKSFRKWVTAEVLPSIRKTGSYCLTDDGGVHVRHSHHRTTNAPSGLDIRYTLDLTKIIVNPKPGSLALLERLTGLSITDIPFEPERNQVERSRQELLTLFDTFAADNLVVDPDGAELFRNVYARFVAWYGATMTTIIHLPSAKGLAMWFDSRGYVRRKPGGKATVYGCSLVAEVAA